MGICDMCGAAEFSFAVELVELSPAIPHLPSRALMKHRVHLTPSSKTWARLGGRKKRFLPKSHGGKTRRSVSKTGPGRPRVGLIQCLTWIEWPKSRGISMH